jgi:hypothetical protein
MGHVREQQLTFNTIKVIHKRAEGQMADYLTKAVDKVKLQKNIVMVGQELRPTRHGKEECKVGDTDNGAFASEDSVEACATVVFKRPRPRKNYYFAGMLTLPDHIMKLTAALTDAGYEVCHQGKKGGPFVHYFKEPPPKGEGTSPEDIEGASYDPDRPIAEINIADVNVADFS